MIYVFSSLQFVPTSLKDTKLLFLLKVKLDNFFWLNLMYNLIKQCNSGWKMTPFTVKLVSNKPCFCHDILSQRDEGFVEKWKISDALSTLCPNSLVYAALLKVFSHPHTATYCLQSFQWGQCGRGEAVSAAAVGPRRSCCPRKSAQNLPYHSEFTVLNLGQQPPGSSQKIKGVTQSVPPVFGEWGC